MKPLLSIHSFFLRLLTLTATGWISSSVLPVACPKKAVFTCAVFLPAISTCCTCDLQVSSVNVADGIVRRVWAACCSSKLWLVLAYSPHLQTWKCERVSKTYLLISSKVEVASQEKNLCMWRPLAEPVIWSMVTGTAFYLFLFVCFLFFFLVIVESSWNCCQIRLGGPPTCVHKSSHQVEVKESAAFIIRHQKTSMEPLVLRKPKLTDGIRRDIFIFIF